MDTFHWACWDRGDDRVIPDGIGPGHVAYGVKGVGKAHFKAIMSWTTDVEEVAVSSADLDLRADFGEVIWGWGTWALRADRGSCCIDEGCLCLVPLIVHFLGH